MLRGALHELIGAAYRGDPSRLSREFVDRFGSDLCGEIVGRLFEDIDAYFEFVETGGCQDVVDFVSGWVEEWFDGEPPPAKFTVPPNGV